MPGAGTRTVTTTNNPPARLLDLTRLISRVGRGPLTGVDRVEFAYLRHLSVSAIPLFLLVRSPVGYILLPDGSASKVLDRIERRANWGPLDLLGRFAWHKPLEQRQALAFLRREALGRCRPERLGQMAQRYLPAGTSVLNVGHSNLDDATLGALRQVAGVQITVLLHDAIPLDFPQYVAQGQPEQFAEKLSATARHADQVIYTAEATKRDLQRHLPGAPDVITAPLGVEKLTPWAGADEVIPDRPYFVTLGTIEPRKNHALLLDVWSAMGPGPHTPALCIVGRRGWRNKDLLQRLGAMKADGFPLVEIPKLEDGAMAGLLLGSHGLLFPSFAEGYGLPPLEAARLNVPVMASDLPVLRETLGDFPVYLSPRDPYSWREMIAAWLETRPTPSTSLDVPSWDAHFRTVLERA